MNQYIKEACVGSLEEAIAAEKNGADRIELCAELHIGGTTPSLELIRQAKERLNIPIRVMIRPRGGDFTYSAEELEVMEESIEVCKAIGVEAVVFGVLDTNRQLDLVQISRLTNSAKPLKVVVHKAIDVTPDPVAALQSLCTIEGIDTVLTSGGGETAFQGAENLKEMLKIGGTDLEVMPAGKVSEENLEELHQLLGARAYHGKKIVGELV